MMTRQGLSRSLTAKIFDYEKVIHMIKNSVKLPIVFVSIFMIVMVLVDALIPAVSFNFKYQPVVSFMIFIFGIAIIAVGGYTFRKAKTTVNPITPELTTHLVTNGIYSLSRNPMYIGFLAWLLACALLIGNLINVILFPLYIILMNKRYIYPEEEALSKLFYDEFEKYKNEVRRWI